MNKIVSMGIGALIGIIAGAIIGQNETVSNKIAGVKDWIDDKCKAAKKAVEEKVEEIPAAETPSTEGGEQQQ